MDGDSKLSNFINNNNDKNIVTEILEKKNITPN